MSKIYPASDPEKLIEIKLDSYNTFVVKINNGLKEFIFGDALYSIYRLEGNSYLWYYFHHFDGGVYHIKDYEFQKNYYKYKSAISEFRKLKPTYWSVLPYITL